MKVVLLIPWAYDYVAESIVAGLSDLNIEFISDQASNGVERQASEELLREWIESKALVIACLGIGLNTNLLSIANKVGNLVLVDGSDYSDLNNLASLNLDFSKLKGVFKREFLIDWVSSPPFERLYPFPMCSTSTQNMVPLEKKYLLTFLGNVRTNPIRGVYMNWFHRKGEFDHLVMGGTTGECSYNAVHPKQNPIATPNYKRVLGESLASVNLPGAGFDCKRYWEIPENHALLVANENQIFIPNDFVTGFEKLEFKNLSELEQIYLRLKHNPGLVLELVNNASEKLRRFHTSKHRVISLLERV